MKLALNKIQFPVTTLGFGRRVGIWTQGCSIGCPGCINQDTWDACADDYVEMDNILEACARWPQADGVTISGGEPFEQPEALACLIKRLKELFAGDLLIFSGFEFEELKIRFPEILEMVDLVVAGPYRADLKSQLVLRGSDNQTIHLLSDLAKARYPADLNERKRKTRLALDFGITENGVSMAGITKRGELSRLRRNLGKRGFRAILSDRNLEQAKR